jgi:hypothetical protein
MSYFLNIICGKVAGGEGAYGGGSAGVHFATNYYSQYQVEAFGDRNRTVTGS